MLNISGIHEGFVLDHIKAGMSLSIYHNLKLDKLDCTVAIIKNAKSNKMGKKDIIKVECPIDALDLDILGFIDHNITVNIIKGDKIVEKKELHLPKQVKNVIRCKNPRCITSIEQELDQIFLLTDEKEETYTKLSNNTYIFEACTLLNDFIKIVDADPDSFKDIEGEADTLAGLILEIKGELPGKNDVITYQSHKFTILEVDNRRIKKIKYERN